MPGRLELAEALGEQLRGDPRNGVTDAVEAGRAVRQDGHDRDAPALAEQVRGPGVAAADLPGAGALVRFALHDGA
jgi:hypothetical protein